MYMYWNYAMNVVRAKVSESGRLSLPAEFRRVVGLERGGEVLIELEGREIRIRSVEEAVLQAQALTRQLLGGKPGVSVDDFLKDRRKDAARE